MLHILQHSICLWSLWKGKKSKLLDCSTSSTHVSPLLIFLHQYQIIRTLGAAGKHLQTCKANQKLDSLNKHVVTSIPPPAALMIGDTLEQESASPISLPNNTPDNHLAHPLPVNQNSASPSPSILLSDNEEDNINRRHRNATNQENTVNPASN